MLHKSNEVVLQGIAAVWWRQGFTAERRELLEKCRRAVRELEDYYLMLLKMMCARQEDQ